MMNRAGAPAPSRKRQASQGVGFDCSVIRSMESEPGGMPGLSWNLSGPHKGWASIAPLSAIGSVTGLRTQPPESRRSEVSPVEAVRYPNFAFRMLRRPGASASEPCSRKTNGWSSDFQSDA